MEAVVIAMARVIKNKSNLTIKWNSAEKASVASLWWFSSGDPGVPDIANTNTVTNTKKIEIQIQIRLQIQMCMDGFPQGNSSASCSGNCRVTTQNGN